MKRFLKGFGGIAACLCVAALFMGVAFQQLSIGDLTVERTAWIPSLTLGGNPATGTAGTALTATPAELNILDGATITTAELNELDLSVVGAQTKLKRIAISTTPTGSAQDTGWDLPTKGVVLDVWVDVTTVEATGGTKTLDVGLLAGEAGGDADGFLDGISVATTAGVRKGNAVATTGSNNTYLGAASTHTIGALLTGLLIAGEDTAAGGDGVLVPRPHILNGTAKSVVYTAGSNDWAEFRGAIYILYVEFAA
ncbi:MAG: hypothetical protein AMXMBFR84_26110 [Candidatus Hydrogenedentota bacterium]